MIIEQIKYWWKGRYVSPEERDGGAGILFIGVYKRHWTSEYSHSLLNFLRRNWHILLPIIVGAIVALFIHFDSKQETNTNSSSRSHSDTKNLNK